jgi:branched-chain amino acid transport system substrate-binding protein
VTKFIVPLVTAVVVVSIIFAGCVPEAAPPEAPPTAPPEAPPTAPPEAAPPEAPPEVEEYPLGKPVIRVGGQDISTGLLADYGWMMKMGSVLAVDEINEAGGILGSTVELKFMDSEWNPEVGLRNAEYMVREWGADFLYGFSADAVPEAIIPHLEELDVLLVHCHSADTRLTEELVYEKGYKNYFRLCNPVYQDAILPAVYFSENRPDIETYALLDAWEYGRMCGEIFKGIYSRHNPDAKCVAEVEHPYGCADFGAMLATLAAEKPNAIFTTAPGGMGISALRQATMMGLFQEDWFKVWYHSMGGALDVGEAIGQDLAWGSIPEGKLWASSRYQWNASDREANVKFVTAFHDQFGRYPTYTAATGYTAIMLFKKACEETRSLDTQAHIAYLEDLEVDDMPLGMADEACGHSALWIRGVDHQGCYTTPLGHYTYDPDVTRECGILVDFSDIPWCDYYRNPPDYENP